MPAAFWWVPFVFELLKLLPAIIRAVKNDPCPDNKDSAKIVLKRIKKATVGESTELKNI